MKAAKILVVDDEMIIARELESRLKHLGYEVPGIASSGEEAIQLAEEIRPDLVLMDIVLKGQMDGIEAATEIRKRRSVPIIYVTAYTDDTTLNRARITEPFGYIVKPFSERELRSNIEMALYKHQVDDRLRRVEKWFAASMERLSEGIVAADREGVVTFINAEAQSLTGRASGQAVGEKLQEVVRLVNRADRAPLGDLVERALAEGLVSHLSDETQLASISVEYRDVDVIAARVRDDGEGGGIVVVLRDLSERNRMRHSLEESKAQLRRNNEALLDANRRKDEFLATLAHELRNPLAPIRNGLQILRSAPLDRDSEPVREMMERQFVHLVRLVDDLMDVSRVSRGRIDLKRELIPLGRLIDATVEASRPFIEAAGHALTVSRADEPAWLDGDLVRLTQVVGNLLNNAAKYTPANGRISLSAAVEGQQVVIRVADDGAGISPEMLPTVFDMFTQVDQTLNRSQGGLGIGLCLVKKIAEMHGATVEAASPGVGLGSVFTVRLPLAPPPRADQAPAPRADAPADPADPPPRLRILVVDDNVDSARSLSILLKMWRHSTRVAHDGPGAIDSATEFQPDLIFLDIGLPGMDGYEVVRRLRAIPGLAGSVVVALTGWGSPTDKSKARDAGFDMHLVKPVDPDEIEAFLGKMTDDRGQDAAKIPSR